MPRLRHPTTSTLAAAAAAALLAGCGGLQEPPDGSQGFDPPVAEDSQQPGAANGRGPSDDTPEGGPEPEGNQLVEPAAVATSARAARSSPRAVARRYAELEGNWTSRTFADRRDRLRELAVDDAARALAGPARTDRLPSSSRSEIENVSLADDQPADRSERAIYVVTLRTVGQSADVTYRATRVRVRNTGRGWRVAAWTEVAG